VRLRIITALAVGVVAFYLGIEVAPGRAPATIEIPDSLSSVTIAAEPHIRETSVTVVAVQSHTDRLETFAAIAALVAAAFLLARLGFVVAKRVRLRLGQR
jgi:hypothetical protein